MKSKTDETWYSLDLILEKIYFHRSIMPFMLTHVWLLLKLVTSNWFVKKHYFQYSSKAMQVLTLTIWRENPLQYVLNEMF